MTLSKIAIGICAVLLLNCSSDLVDVNGKPAPSSEWVFVSADGITPIEGFTPQITVRDGNFAGRLGCNHFNGHYRASSQTLEIHLGGQTEIGCGQPILEREQNLALLIGAVNRYKVEGNQLTLFTGDGRQAIFTARVPKVSPPLVTTNWRLQSAAEMGMVATSPSIQEVTAVFSNDSVRFSHPCFELTASYTQNSTSVVFRITSSKDRACGKPADITANAKSMGTLLTESDRMAIVEERLSLRSGSRPRLDFTAQNVSTR